MVFVKHMLAQVLTCVKQHTSVQGGAMLGLVRLWKSKGNQHQCCPHDTQGSNSTLCSTQDGAHGRTDHEPAARQHSRIYTYLIKHSFKPTVDCIRLSHPVIHCVPVCTTCTASSD
jgi:hypothetical protein